MFPYGNSPLLYMKTETLIVHTTIWNARSKMLRSAMPAFVPWKSHKSSPSSIRLTNWKPSGSNRKWRYLWFVSVCFPSFCWWLYSSFTSRWRKWLLPVGKWLTRIRFCKNWTVNFMTPIRNWKRWTIPFRKLTILKRNTSVAIWTSVPPTWIRWTYTVVPWIRLRLPAG